MVWETHDGRPSGVSATAAPDYAYAIQNKTALAAIPASQRADKQVRYVETERLFFMYDDNASAGDIQPGDSDGTGVDPGNGWWIRAADPDIRAVIQSLFLPYGQQADNFYVVVASFVFRGTTALGSPVAADFILWHGESGGAGWARIYDVTNANVIAEVGPFSTETPTRQTDSSLTNLPAGEAIFEVQLKAANGKEFRISETVLRYR